MPPFIHQQETQVSPGAVQSLLAGPHCSFDLDPAVHSDRWLEPGEPVSFIWSVYDFHNGLSPAPDPGWSASISYSGNVVWADSVDPRGQIVIADHGAALAQQFYRVGSSPVLVLHATKPGAEPLTATLVLDVVAPGIDSTWFAWEDGPTSVRWKQDTYTVAGVLSNRSRWTSLTFTPVLDESAAPGSEEPLPPRHLGAPQGTATFSIPPGGSAEMAWAPITQAWMPWFDRVFLVPDFGAVAKTFDYTASYEATDQYGNAYSTTRSAVREITVTVSDWKVNDVRAALAAQATAITLTAIGAFAGPLSAGFLAAAATAEAVAQVFAVAALDPPTPDPRFREAVAALSPTALPAALAAEPALNATASLLQAVGTVADGHSTLETIHGRILGALEAQDVGAAAEQAKAYADAVATIETAASNALSAVEPAVGEFAEAKVDPTKLGAFHADWQLAAAMPKEIEAALLKAGSPQDQVDLLSQAGGSPDLALLASDPPGVLRTLAANSGAVAVLIRQQTPSVLRLVPAQKANQ